MVIAIDWSYTYWLCSVAPLLGPSLGPIIGGFVTEHTNWKWMFFATSIADAVVQIVGIFWLHETNPRAILQRKAKKLRKETGNLALYTQYDTPKHTLSSHLGKAISRPFRLLFTQLIVQVMAIYMAYIYGMV